MEYGYTRKDAELLLKWFKLEKVPEERDLTKSEILKLYHYRFIKKEDAKTYLMSLGYDDAEAEYLLSLEDYKVFEEIVEEEIESMRIQYIRGLIDDKKFFDFLNALGLPAEKITYEMVKAQREKKKVEKIPTKTDLINMLKLGVIDEKEFRENMKLQGYSDKWIDRYLRMVKGGAS